LFYNKYDVCIKAGNNSFNATFMWKFLETNCEMENISVRVNSMRIDSSQTRK